MAAAASSQARVRACACIAVSAGVTSRTVGRILPGPRPSAETESERKEGTKVGIIAWIVLGAIAGFIASALVGGGEGIVGMVILGIIGAVVGGYVAGNLLHVADVTGLNLESIVVAVFGAIIVVAAYRALVRRRRVL
jgi:uncharacterized membrane protein YeaQ/YmgE (transglycosylase-associated protein family)